MKADPISFKRATSVSLFGLAIQGVLALAFLLYGVFGRDASAITAFYATLLGIPVWLGLALVFHQHRLERLEAMEAELYATSSAAQASVFEGVEDELRVAAKRLAWMHRILLPIISLVVGATLVGIGLWRFQSGKAALSPVGFVAPGMTGWAVSLGIGVAAIGFIFARFVAGMAKQKIWANLRAGASYLVGTSLIGLALGIAHGVAFAGNDIALRYLHVALPILLILQGAEVFLNFVLNIYRPRRAGEIPRPAFDSRILGFLATPDRIVESISDAINYQFGFDVTSTWFYQLLSRSVLSLAGLAVAVLWLMSTLAVVRANEKGLLLQYGRLVGEVNSGLLWKWPYPFQSIETFPALSVRQMSVGAASPNNDGPILWTNPHTTDEAFLLVQPPPASSDVVGSTNKDLALLAIEVVVEYTVGDLVAYRTFVADSDDPDDRDRLRRELLRSIASRELIQYAATLTIDDILGEKRAQMGTELRRLIEARYAALGPLNHETGKPAGAGVEVLFVGVAGAHPPQSEEVALSFEGVVSAEQNREAKIEYAREQAIRTLAKVAGDAELANRLVVEIDKLEAIRSAPGADPHAVAEQAIAVETLLASAGGEAAVKIQQARAERWERHMNALGLATRHEGNVALFKAAPKVYMAKLYLDALREAAQGTRLFITTFLNPRIRVNFEEVTTNISGFKTQSANKE